MGVNAGGRIFDNADDAAATLGFHVMPATTTGGLEVALRSLRRDGVLTDGRLYFDNQGNEMKSFSTRDGLGMRLLGDSGITLALITARTSNIVARRAANLGIEREGCQQILWIPPRFYGKSHRFAGRVQRVS